MAISSSAISLARLSAAASALGARPVAHRGHHLVERPFEIDRGRPRGGERGAGALEIFVGGIRAQRQPHAIGRGGTNQRRAAHLHRFDGVHGVGQRLEPHGGEAVRQQRLVDDADAVPSLSTQIVRICLPSIFMG